MLDTFTVERCSAQTTDAGNELLFIADIEVTDSKQDGI